MHCFNEKRVSMYDRKQGWEKGMVWRHVAAEPRMTAPADSPGTKPKYVPARFGTAGANFKGPQLARLRVGRSGPAKIFGSQELGAS